MAAPIPLDAPVTTATFPASFFVVLIFQLCCLVYGFNCYSHSNNKSQIFLSYFFRTSAAISARLMSSRLDSMASWVLSSALSNADLMWQLTMQAFCSEY